jgi:hypothetical protein
MSQQNKTQLQSLINTNIADNTVGDITAQDVRDSLINVTDSLLFNSGSQTFDGTLTATAFVGDGSAITGVTGEWDGSLNGNAEITGSLTVTGDLLPNRIAKSGNLEVAGNFLALNSLTTVQVSGPSGISIIGDPSIDGDVAIEGNTLMTGSLTASGSVVDFTNATAISGSTFSGSFVGDGSGLTGIDTDPFPYTGNASFTGTTSMTGSLTISDSLDVTNFITASKISINDGGGSVFVGEGAGLNDDASSNNNTGIGNSTLLSNTTGNNNVGVGYSNLSYLTSGNYNTTIGSNALGRLVNGGSNTAIGSYAGASLPGGSPLLTADESIFIGDEAKPNSNSGTNQIVIGYNTTGNGSNTVTIGNSSITNNYFNGDVSATSFTGNIGIDSSSTTTMNGIFTTEEYIVSSLPSSPATGSRAHVTDATATTFYSTVTGGGSEVVPVFYNGTDWVIA